MENYILGGLKDGKANYWRTTSKAEVDFVFAETIPIEVKSSPKITRSFRSFIESYKPPFAVLVTLTTYNKTKIGDTKVFIVPLALLYREL